MPTLGFGKYAGEDIRHVRRDYLEYLLDWDELWDETREEIEGELADRDCANAIRQAEVDAEMAERFPDPDAIPFVPPLNVFGVWLDSAEAWELVLAWATGELYLGPDTPVASELPEAWCRLCHRARRPWLVRRESWAEVAAKMEEV